MTTRAVPVMPNFFAGQNLTASLLNQVGTFGNFWANPPSVRAYQSVSQSITTGTDTQITMDTLDYDSDGAWQNSTPYNIIIPAGMTGRWQFTWSVPTGVNATGARDSYIKRNGNRITGSVTVGVAASNDFTQSTGSTTIGVNAGDVMSVWLWQNSGVTLGTTAGGNNGSVFEARLVSLGTP